MTPPKYAQQFPGASKDANTRALGERVEARIAGKDQITPPQFAALLSAWRLAKLS